MKRLACICTEKPPKHIASAVREKDSRGMRLKTFDIILIPLIISKIKTGNTLNSKGRIKVITEEIAEKVQIIPHTESMDKVAFVMICGKERGFRETLCG